MCGMDILPPMRMQARLLWIRGESACVRRGGGKPAGHYGYFFNKPLLTCNSPLWFKDFFHKLLDNCFALLILLGILNMGIITVFIFTMFNCRKSLIKIIAIIGLLSFALFMAFSVAKLHIHTLPNGRIIAHSHPFDSDDGDGRQSHRHSAREFAQINTINKTLSNLLIIAIVLTFFKVILYPPICDTINIFRSAPYLCHHQNRAPPPVLIFALTR